MHVSAIWAVFQFERKRTATTTRWLWWLILSLFPIAISLFIRIYVDEEMMFSAFSLMLFYMIPAVVCVMGQLLWATPSVQSELEGKTWSFIALKPYGKIHLLLGKYLTSVAWTFFAALVCLTVVLFVTTPKVSHFERKEIVIEVPRSFDGFNFGNKRNRQTQQGTVKRRVGRLVPVEKMSNSERIHLWWIMATLSLFSCLNYGALFCLIGTILPRRAMVLAIGYTVIFELIVGFIPAIINQLTIQFRLRSLLLEWSGGELTGLTRNNPIFQSETSQWQHIGILLLLFPFLLAAGSYILHRRELIVSEDVN